MTLIILSMMRRTVCFMLQYKKLAEELDGVIFGGRLGEYKYYDMDAVVAAALDKAEERL